MVFKIARGVHWRPPNPFNAKGKKITERKYRATSVQQSTIVIKLKKTKKKKKNAQRYWKMDNLKVK